MAKEQHKEMLHRHAIEKFGAASLDIQRKKHHAAAKSGAIPAPRRMWRLPQSEAAPQSKAAQLEATVSNFNAALEDQKASKLKHDAWDHDEIELTQEEIAAMLNATGGVENMQDRNKNLSIETKKKFSQRHTNGVKQTNELNITKEN